MNRTLMQLRTKTVEFWRNRSKLQKILMIGGVAALAIIITVVSIFASSEKMVPLFRDLSEAEAGQIKQELDGKNVKSELANNGTTILVPEKQADTLKVTLASEGLPKTGNIDYSFFANNSGFGLTDNEFDVLKVDATQTELSNLINTIDGIKDSKVMINLPKDSVFVGEEQSNASASIVLQVQPGYTLTQQQVKGLYHLISKSVPNLKTENIVIMDQDSNYYDLNSSSDSYASGMDAQQQKKEEIEKNLQRKIQQLLGTMMGQEKVAVSVTTDIDFTEEKEKKILSNQLIKKTCKELLSALKRLLKLIQVMAQQLEAPLEQVTMMSQIIKVPMERMEAEITKRAKIVSIMKSTAFIKISKKVLIKSETLAFRHWLNRLLQTIRTH